ncbi:MAG TPA: DUF4286 family protein [Phycisphaerales bacterium]|nr:DUF4286 family protein [Phycisphaerales bacterium]
MAAIAYTVTATLPDEGRRAEYITWLQDGHVDAVIAAGARSAMIVSVEEPREPPRVHARYIFPTREALELYLEQHAPALREEGLRRFGPETGVEFRREVGRVI